MRTAAFLPSLVVSALCACSEPVQAPLPAASITALPPEGDIRDWQLTRGLRAQVVDQGGMPVAGVLVYWSTEDTYYTINPDTSLTDHQGIARTAWRLPPVPGSHRATASVPGLESADFSATLSAPSSRSAQVVFGGGCFLDHNDRPHCWNADTGIDIRAVPVGPDAPVQDLVVGGPTDTGRPRVCVIDLAGWPSCSQHGVRWPSGRPGDRVPPELLPLEGLPAPLVHLESHYNRWCGLLTSGEVWCWGTGDLGDGPRTNGGTPRRIAAPDSVRFVALNLSDEISCAIDTEGTPWCWGRQYRGSFPEHPIGAVIPTPIPIAVPEPLIAIEGTVWGGACGLGRGGHPICWGDWATLGRNDFARPPGPDSMAPRRIGGGITLTEIAGLWHGFIGRTADGTMMVWGCFSDHAFCIGAPRPHVSVHPGLRAARIWQPSGRGETVCINELLTGASLCGEARDWLIPDSWIGGARGRVQVLPSLLPRNLLGT